MVVDWPKQALVLPPAADDAAVKEEAEAVDPEALPPAVIETESSADTQEQPAESSTAAAA